MRKETKRELIEATAKLFQSLLVVIFIIEMYIINYLALACLFGPYIKVFDAFTYAMMPQCTGTTVSSVVALISVIILSAMSLTPVGWFLNTRVSFIRRSN